VGETVSLQVNPRIEVIDSSNRTSKCERLHINGLQRLNHIDKYAHSLKLVLSSNTSNILRTSTHVCFHRNSSSAIGMCPHGQWTKLSEGSWVGVMSPFDYKILDVRTSCGGSSKAILEFSATQEFFMYRIVFLIMGTVLLSSASTLSMSLPFYYFCAVSFGIIILVTLIINQGMKRLLTGGKSRLELFLYSSMIGVGGYSLQYFNGLIQHLLMQIGASEDLYIIMAILAGAFVFLFGAWSGFWTVKKFLVTKDGSVDITTSVFVSWTIRAFAAILILQSSLDPFLAGGTLISGIIISSALKSISRKLLSQRIDDETENRSSLGLNHSTTFASPLPKGIKKMQRKTQLSDSDTFPSSFHKTPKGRRKFSKKELEKFSRESTEKAVKELVSSPGFGEWAAKNARRIIVNPIEVKRRDGSSDSEKQAASENYFNRKESVETLVTL
ncbi:unnamed protein product, partial [Thlaspi arvense]